MDKELAKKEYGVAVIKGLLATIPFVGTFINEIIFDARSRIKQERVNSFIAEFSNFIEHKSEITQKINKIDEEKFSDVFEEILVSASKTSATYKIAIFKQILVKQFDLCNETTDEAIRFINLTNSITLHQFNILTKFNSLSDKVLLYKVKIIEAENEIAESKPLLQKEIRRATQGSANSRLTYENRINKAEESIRSKTKALNENINPSNNELYGLTREEYLIEIHDLIGKGLIQDLALETSFIKPLELFKITIFGRKYIEYVKEAD